MTHYIHSNQKNRSVLVPEHHYKEVIDNAASYNARLCIDRRMRLPFLDSQTGVAQNHSNLWIPYRYRGPGQAHGQLYTYPARRWKKKCNLSLPDMLFQNFPHIKMTHVDNSDAANNHTSTTVENTSLSGGLGTSAPVGGDADSNDVPFEEGATPATTSRGDEYYGEWEQMSDAPDTAGGEADHRRNSDSSEFEEAVVKKKAKKKETKKKASGTKEAGVRGKTSTDGTSGKGKKKEKEVIAEPVPERDEPSISEASGTKKILKESKTGIRYCDFCLGDEMENKKTGTKEEMVSCADCGRSGHPSCLQFTANMIISVRKYPWQCIECKSCGLCGTSDNDDQLLFCDDCDRGYHMYCLKPPLSEPPEGSWSCHLCIIEFYGGANSPIIDD